MMDVFTPSQAKLATLSFAVLTNGQATTERKSSQSGTNIKKEA